MHFVLFSCFYCYLRNTTVIMFWNDITLMGCLYWVYCVIAIIVMVKVVLNNRDTIKTLAWMLVLIFLPFLGLVLYFFFGRDNRKKKIISGRMLSQIQQRSHLYAADEDAVEVPNEYESLVSFFENSASAPLLGAESVEVISSTEKFASALLSEIRGAKEHVHLQFYIFEDDGFGRSLRDLLIEKAKEGLEVRVIYDSVGCWNVKRDFFESMRCAGIYVESFLKVRFPLFTNKVNYRNHRKLVVIDGKAGFVGGCNIADRYLRGVKWGAWRDTMLFVRGAAVHGLQASFLVDWYFANSSLVCGKHYFPHSSADSRQLVQVVQSNPVGDIRTVMTGFIKILSTARSYVYLQTPYFMPNEAFVLALKGAALSGVDVRLMVPERSDSWVTDYASRSYFAALLSSGIKIYLYQGGMLHGKTLVCDDSISSVGSVNLDFRSFFYNFEVSAFVYGKETASELKDAFLEDVKLCTQLTAGEFNERSLKERCLESVSRLFSPLL